MHSEIRQKIEKYRYDIDTPEYVISNFLSGSITNGAYRSIKNPGDSDKISHDDKVKIVMNYISENSKPKVKQKLRLMIADDSESEEYINYLSTEFDIEIVKNNKSEDYIQDVDLILFTGGEDVSPNLYYEEKGKYTQNNEERDSIESNVFYNTGYNTPKLGICRGAQFLTVMAGGKLIQDVKGHTQTHLIETYCGKRFNITSTHHQMMYPFNLEEEKYELIAYSEKFRSTSYLNGKNEEIELHKDFLEPEIVYYPNTNSLCIQGHPEYGNCEDFTKRECMRLIKKYLIDKKEVIKQEDYEYDYEEQ